MASELVRLTAAIQDAWRTHTRRTKGRPQRTTPRDYLTASGLSECGRAMALDLMHPGDAPEFDDDTLERFYRGDDIEATKNARLHMVGLVSTPPFRVHGQQREVEIFDRTGKTLLIRGKIEGTLDFYTERVQVDYEIKSGEAVKHAETLDDLFQNQWTRKYLRQFLAYLYAQVQGGRGNGCGVFILDRPGLPVMIPIDLAADDRLLHAAEEVLQKSEAAVLARRGEAPLPDFIPDPGICQRCFHLGKSCHPPIDLGPGAEIDEDEVAQANLERFLATKEAALENERAKRYLFGEADKPGRYRGRKMVLAGGKYLVEGKWSPYTKFKIPPEVRDQYKEVDPEGSWKPKVTEIVSSAKD